MTAMSDVPARGEAGRGVTVDPSDPDFIRDPYPTYTELRNTCPVAHSDRFGGFWMLSQYGDVKDAARDTTLFSSAKGITVPPAGNPMPFLPIELDPPDHTKYRRVMQTWFSVREMDKLEPQIRELVVELIDNFQGRGHADLAEELAGVLPPVVIALLLGLPREEWPRFRELAESMIAAAEAEDQNANAVAAFELMGYLGTEIEARREAPRDDMLTRMIAIEIDGQPIPPEAVLGLAFFMLLAGHETSVAGLSMMLMHVATNPDVKQRLLDEPALIAKAVEESLRLDSPVQTLARTAEQDVCLRGADLVAGDRVVLAWASANRDPSVFHDPDQFVLDRAPNPHVAFGYGIHRCLGASLARLEMRVVLEEVLRRIPNYRISEDSEIEVGGILARHLMRLPVEW